jgi:uncharacterized protein YegP (UPF0339 family)
VKIKLSKHDWQKIGKTAGWLKKSDQQLDFFQVDDVDDPISEELGNENKIQEETKPVERQTLAFPELISAYRQATGEYGVEFKAPNGKIYFYSIGFYNGKGPSEVQKWIKKLAIKNETKQKALRVAEKSAIWAAELDGNGRVIRELDLNNIR